MSGQIQGFQSQSDGKGCTSLIPQDSGQRLRWACLSTFFLALGLVEFAAGTPGTCIRRQEARWGQSRRRDRCTGAGPCSLSARTRG